MQTPTLSKKQIKSSLSAKKTTRKEKILLSVPVNQFWPTISNEESKKLTTVLEENLPRFKLTKVNIPWKEVKSISKENRKEYRKKFTIKKIKDKEQVDDATVLSNVLLGVNKILRSLEKGDVSVVLAAVDVVPRILVQPLIQQCVDENVPILLMSLRQILKERCGISSIAVGIKKEASVHPNLNRIIENVKNLYVERHPPESRQNNLSPTKNVEESTTMFTDKENKSESANMDIEEITDNNIVSEMHVKESKPKETKIDEDKIRNVFYLRRESKTSRVFVPKIVEHKENKTELNCNVKSTRRKNLKKLYKPLTVKRVKNDVDRKKRILKNTKKN